MGVIDEVELVRLYCEERWSLEDIGLKVGWSSTVIRQVLVALGVQIRTAWEHNQVACTIDEIRRLYVDEGMSLNAVAAELGCSSRTVLRRLVAAGVARREDGGVMRYARHDFSGSPTEKAYLIGFRIGDLHVALQGERTVLVKCTSTRPEQVELFRQLFAAYGHVYTDEAGLTGRMRQSIGMQVGLNLSFEFLLPKPKSVPDWILESDEPFFAFLAGYIDAEGYFRAYFHTNQPKPLGRLEIRSYDEVLLRQLGEGLNKRGIRCPPAQFCVAAGYTNVYDVTSNQDLWRLGVQRADSLRALIKRLEPHIQHARRRRDIVQRLSCCYSANMMVISEN